MESLDAISMGVFSYLTKDSRVSHLDNKAFVGASSAQLALWEQRNHPFQLPEDLKRFYTITNGLSIKWFAPFKGQATLVGHFALNGVQDLQRNRVDRFASLVRSSDRHRVTHVHPDDSATTFTLELTPEIGEIAVVYFSDKSTQIWFRDLRGSWSFLAQSFTHYYRLMIAHFGLISWQAIFSDGGVDPLRKPWFYLFIPQRMMMDEQDESRTQPPSNCSARSQEDVTSLLP